MMAASRFWEDLTIAISEDVIYWYRAEIIAHNRFNSEQAHCFEINYTNNTYFLARTDLKKTSDEQPDQ